MTLHCPIQPLPPRLFHNGSSLWTLLYLIWYFYAGVKMRDGKLRYFSEVASKNVKGLQSLHQSPKPAFILFLSWLQPSLSQVPTSILCFSWNRPSGKLLQDVVKEELQTSVWEDSNECGGQTSVESLRPFCLVHCHHCMAKVGVDLDNKEEAEWLSSELKTSKSKVR